MKLSKLVDELIGKVTSLVLTATLVGTVLWPFLQPGAWDRCIKYGYIASAVMLSYYIIPILYYFIKAEIYKRKLQRK